MADEMNLPAGDLMRGKRGVVMGVANRNSIAYAIAAQLAAQGAEMAWTYVDAMERRVKPLGEALGVKHFVPADVSDDASMEAPSRRWASCWRGGSTSWCTPSPTPTATTSRARSWRTPHAPASRTRWTCPPSRSVDAARRAAPMMPPGASMLTLTYLGSERVIPNYNVMGVAKAALEAATRYIARDLGPRACASTPSALAPSAPCRWRVSRAGVR